MTPSSQAPITVLVVDDEPVVRNVVSTGLGSRGFSVLPAASGPEAVAVYARHRADIQLVLLDVRMSPWDGPRTLAELRALDPDVRAVFMSGSTGSYSAADLLLAGASGVIGKPFASFTRLADELRAILGAG